MGTEGTGVGGLLKRNASPEGGVGILEGAAELFPKKFGTEGFEGGGPEGVVEPLVGCPIPRENDFLGRGATGVAASALDPKKFGTPEVVVVGTGATMGGVGVVVVKEKAAEGVLEVVGAGGAGGAAKGLGEGTLGGGAAEDELEGAAKKLDAAGAEEDEEAGAESILERRELVPFDTVLDPSFDEAGAPGRTNLILSKAPRSSSSSAGRSSSRADILRGPGVPLRELTAETCFLEVLERARSADRAREVGSLEARGWKAESSVGGAAMVRLGGEGGLYRERAKKTVRTGVEDASRERRERKGRTLERIRSEFQTSEYRRLGRFSSSTCVDVWLWWETKENEISFDFSASLKLDTCSRQLSTHEFPPHPRPSAILSSRSSSPSPCLSPSP